MLKRIIKTFFQLLGYKIVSTRKVTTPKIDPVHHNSLENLEALYSDDEFVSKSLNDRSEFFQEIISFVESHGMRLNDKQIADFGCGIGFLLKFIKDKYPNSQVFGYEYSKEAIKHCKKLLPNGSFIEYDMYSDVHGNYDVVFCSQVLEHLLHPEIAIKNLIKATKSGGILMITVPDGRIDTYSGHINFWSPESWEQFIKSHSTNYTFSTGKLNDVDLFALISN